MISAILKKLVEKKDLTAEETDFVFEGIMAGGLTEVQSSSFLTALQIKGASEDEILSALNVIKSRSIKVTHAAKDITDTCGTGGDNRGTFNISTAAAIIASGAGVKVAKHGNRSSTSRCGSADVLEALGVNIDIGPDKAKDLLEGIGLCFMYAPIYHPSFRNISKIRKELGFRTVFNFLGPLCNPAAPSRQVIGVYDAALTEKIANVLKKSGAIHSLVVNSEGMDEISTFSRTKITELKGGAVRTYFLDPADYGFSGSAVSIKGGDPAENMEIIRGILAGRKSNCRDIAVMNAAAAIYVSGIASSIAEGIKLAEKSIDDSAASSKLRSLIEVSNS